MDSAPFSSLLARDSRIVDEPPTFEFHVLVRFEAMLL